VSIHIHSDYYIDTLEKRYCLNCQKAFIVGEELSKTVNPVRCSYCISDSTEVTAYCNKDFVYEFGCMALYFHKTDDEYYDVCLFCGKRLDKDTVAIQSACKNCSVKKQGEHVSNDFNASEIINKLVTFESESKALEYLDSLKLKRPQIQALIDYCNISVLKSSTVTNMKKHLIDFNVGVRLRRNAIMNVDVSFKQRKRHNQ